MSLVTGVGAAAGPGRVAVGGARVRCPRPSSKACRLGVLLEVCEFSIWLAPTSQLE